MEEVVFSFECKKKTKKNDLQFTAQNQFDCWLVKVTGAVYFDEVCKNTCE